MTSPARPTLFMTRRKHLLTGGLVLIAIGLLQPHRSNAQTITLDFRFDSSGTAAQTLVAGSAGQTFTIDVFATIKGDASHTDVTQYGLQTVFFRGRSDQSGGGAFATGTFVGGTPSSFVGTGQFGQSGNATAPSNVADNGSTTDGVNLSTTADGIIDFGATANNGAKESSTVGYVFNTTATQAGFVTAANGGLQFEIAQFKFTTGTTSSTVGAISKFWPTVPGATATEAQFTQDHGTTNTILSNTSAQNPQFVIGTPLTFSVISGGGGNDSTLNLAPPSTVTINSLAGGTNTTTMTVTNTAADAATATGQFTTSLTGTNAASASLGTITNNPVGTTPAQIPVNYAAAAAPTTTAATFTLSITNTSNASDATGNKSTNFSVNVGDATADNSNSQPTAPTFGPAMTASVPHNGSYAGLSSQVTSLTGTGGFDAGFGAIGIANGLGRTATILAGTNSTANGNGTATVAMKWRTLSTSGAINEQTGAGSGFKGRMYSPGLAAPTTGLISDVVDVSGLTVGAESAGGATDPFVLQMSYNPALLPKGSTTNNHTTFSTLEGSLAANKLINLVSFSGTTWDRAVDDNTGNAITLKTDPSYGYLGSYAQYISAGQPGNGKTLAQTLGAWGVDTTNHVIWADVNHNSQFAVVPEPATILLAGLGLLGLVGLRRRINAAA